MSALLLLMLLAPAGCVMVARQRRDYDKVSTEKLKPGKASEFTFARFQRLDAVKGAFDDCRSPSSFKRHEGKDGRKGYVCSTKLGGDWVLAESEQVAVSCTCEQVLRAYLDGGLQKRWNADKVADVKFTRHAGRGGVDAHYQQDISLHSIRVIRSKTGTMRYTQRVTVDRIGHNYCAFVQLDPEQASTARKPFESLAVYVGLRQDGKNVRIYAAGVFEVNRRVVPNLVVFDASGIAGDMAGKGTLWLAGHFEERKRAAEASSAGAWTAGWKDWWKS